MCTNLWQLDIGRFWEKFQLLGGKIAKNPNVLAPQTPKFLKIGTFFENFSIFWEKWWFWGLKSSILSEIASNTSKSVENSLFRPILAFFEKSQFFENSIFKSPNNSGHSPLCCTPYLSAYQQPNSFSRKCRTYLKALVSSFRHTFLYISISNSSFYTNQLNSMQYWIYLNELVIFSRQLADTCLIDFLIFHQKLIR